MGLIRQALLRVLILFGMNKRLKSDNFNSSDDLGHPNIGLASNIPPPTYHVQDPSVTQDAQRGVSAGCTIPLLLVLLLFTSFLPLAAQTEVTNSNRCKFYFRVGKAEIDLSYRENGKRIALFADSLNQVLRDTSNRILAVYIDGSASPEGSHLKNELLARQRAESIRNYLLQHTNLDPAITKAYSIGINWAELVQLLEASNHRNRQALISIINSNSNFADNKQLIDQLKAIDKGASWRWMQDSLFNELRQGEALMKCLIKKRQPDTISDTIRQEKRDTVYIAYNTPPVDYEESLPYHRKTVAAIRSNLLLPLLNIGVDVPINNRWSVALDWYYPWLWRSWHKSSEMKDCFELLDANATLRYWLGKKHQPGQANWSSRLTGHAIGLNLGWGYYDIGQNYTGYQGDFYHVGLEYSYAKALGKRKMAFLHFSLSVGYVYSIAEGYKVYDEGGHAFRTGLNKRVNWIGPTKAEVALVIPIYKKIRKED